MSTEEESKKPESEMGLDLDLHFLPSWAQKPAASNQYEQYTGEEGAGRERRGRRDDRGPRGPRRDGPRGPGGPGGGSGGFRGGPRGEGQRQGGGGGPRGDRDRGRGPRRGGPGGQGGPGGRPADRPQVKLPELEVSFIPEEKGVESLARQIKLTGRAYPLFEIAYLVLKKPERYHVELVSKKKEDGQAAQLIYVCDLDDTIWLDETEAMHHVLDKHFGTFYSTEKIPTDPPKGVYTFVAQCGMSGTILGPPNYHDYQNKVTRLHQERFSRMPFDMFKSRIRIVKDEAVVKKWLEDQSFRTEFTCLNIPETIKLNSREEVERHFRETHLANVIKPVESYTLPGTAAVNLQNRGLQALLRRSYDEQMRFPLKVVNILSGQFARQGLHFFKVNKTVTHVAVARPKFLDFDESPVSEGIKQIVEYINTHPRTTRKKLLEALAPGAAPAAVPATGQAEQPPATPAVEGEQASAGEGQVLPAAEPPPVVSGVPGESSAAAAVVSNLHWLIHQGHVIEFANGILETAKKPAPRPPKPEKKAPAVQAGQGKDAAVENETSEGSSGEGTAEAGQTGETAAAEANAGSDVTVQDESGTSAGGNVPAGDAFPLSGTAPQPGAATEDPNKPGNQGA